MKLVDFGLAKLSAEGEGPNLTRSDQAMGTPRYMAPEQLERPREVDHRADIFSLGVVLYEMLTGQVPAGVIEPPSRKVSVDIRLDEVVLRSLQREPERRYQSAADLEAGVKGASDEAAAPAGERPRAAAAAPGPVRAGFTLADLVAVLILPTSLVVASVALRPSGDDLGVQPGLVWEVLLRFNLLGLLWWGLPILTGTHWLLSRRRDFAVPPAMPMLRTVWALVLTACVFALEATLGHLPAVAPESVRALIDAERGFLVTAGLLAAVLGAWSRKGAHRRLVGPEMERALLGLTAVLAGLAALVAVVASFSARAPMEVPARSIGGDGLAFAVKVPIFAAGVVAAVLARGGNLRPATFVLTIGASVTLLAHLLGSIHYGDWNGPVLGSLLGAVVIGLVTVAGTAEPQPRPAPPQRDRARAAVPGRPADSRARGPEGEAGRSRASLVLLGLVTLVPAASLAATLVRMVVAFAELDAASGAAGSEALGRAVSEALGPTIYGWTVLAPLVVFYLWHAASRGTLESASGKWIWVVLLVFAAPFSMPVYWYAHLWAPRFSGRLRSGA